MDITSAHKEFTYRVNKLGSNANAHVGLSQFVSLMNKAQLHWAEVRVKVAERDRVRADETQQLLVDYPDKGVKSKNFYKYKLPADYMHLSRAVGYTDCGPLYAHNVEEGNMNTLLSDSFTSPSSAWEETLCTVVGGYFRLYAPTFTIKKADFTYYRVPKPVDIKGYKHLDGSDSVNKNLEFDGTNALEIIDLAAMFATSDVGDMDRLATLSRQIQEHN